MRNPDTRSRDLSAGAFSYAAGPSRAGNSLRVTPSGANANLSWSCAGCDAANPARIYRAQNAAFNLYLEPYNGGIGGAYTNTGAVSSAQSYFWTVE